ncbi:MAG: hypothetical protein Q7Q71_10980 [Verrucomicrobiota bacterium JB023]|nr:hypothetical protein [Verrucomicrobiota bacterium JB023]
MKPSFPLPIFPLLVQADDLSLLSDEFDNAATLANWHDLVAVEGWHTSAHETADIDITEPGHFHIVPATSMWFENLRGLLFFKEIEGDFIATMKVRVLSRHNPEDPTEVPNRAFSLAGLFIHAPRDITQAAPSPFTTEPVWPPQDFGSDYVPDSENYLFLSYGTAGNAGTRQFETKSTRNSNSRLYYDTTGIDQDQTEAWLQIVRVGDTFVCLRKHSEEGPWIVENRYPNPNHPLPDFGEALQVGITAYTDWPTAQPYWQGGAASTYHFNYAPPATGQPDLISQIDYVRFRRPDPALTEEVLENMAISFLGGGGQNNVTSDPPVLLSASAEAAGFLGESANLPANPLEDRDGDGFTDILEQVLGSDEQDGQSRPLLRASVEDELARFTFPSPQQEGVTLAIQTSADLTEWTTLSTRPGNSDQWSAAPPSHTLADDPESHEMTLSSPLAEGPRFFRLLIY